MLNKLINLFLGKSNSKEQEKVKEGYEKTLKTKKELDDKKNRNPVDEINNSIEYPYIRFGLRFEEIIYQKNEDTFFEFSIYPPNGSITFGNNQEFLNLEMNEKKVIIDEIIDKLTESENSHEVIIGINCNTEFEIGWLQLLEQISNLEKVKQVSMMLIKSNIEEKVRVYSYLNQKNIDIILNNKKYENFKELLK